MTTDTTLIEKREELKRRLAAGEYKTLVDIFLEWFDRLIRKIIRRSEPLPIWGITVSLSLTLSLVSFAAPYFTGELNSARTVIASLGLQYGLAVVYGIWVIVVTTI